MPDEYVEEKPKIVRWVVLGIAITLLVIFHQNVFDALVGDREIGGYSYCGSFEECADAAATAMSELPADMKVDCVKAHTQALTSLAAGKQNDNVRVNNCRVTAAVINDRVGATVWKAY